MALLSLEIPITLLHTIFPLTDLGFSLAHLILDDAQYRTFYSSLPYMHIMDNSMYELGEPLEMKQLKEAAELTKPLTIIAPDLMDDGRITSARGILSKGQLAPSRVGIVIQGKDLLERRDFFHWAKTQNFRPICFPFRNRAERLTLLASVSRHFDTDGWYHLLGINSPEEVQFMKGAKGQWSYDTAKPCKPGVNLRHGVWSGHGKLDFYRKYSYAEVQQVKENIAYLREL